ncbi:MAG TPA: chemotaxis protein CheW [Gemmatimonadales bacterium]|nr:chemotaxis protein CheW [Gemmatimonadales bacterium]
MTALRLLLFRSGGQVLAVEAGAVREIIPAGQITRIPGTSRAVLGLINVRGTLVPVVDTAAAAGIGSSNGAAGTVILVERRGRTVGLAVDEVLDLAAVPTGALDQQAALPGVRPDLVRAVGTAGGQSFVHLATDVLLEPLLP